MLSNEYRDTSQKFLQIKQDSKFYGRLLSRESFRAEPSFRVSYYGGATGAIPFEWESRPGTPKHIFSDTSLPPLTPPPSYQSTTSKPKSTQKCSKPKFFRTIIHRMGSKKNDVSPSLSSPSMSSSCSSSYSSPVTPVNSRIGIFRRRSMSSLHFGVQEDDDKQPTSISCLCFRHGMSREL